MRTGLGVTGALLGLALAGTAHLDREVDVAQGVSRAFEEVSERIAPSVVRIAVSYTHLTLPTILRV